MSRRQKSEHCYIVLTILSGGLRQCFLGPSSSRCSVRLVPSECKRRPGPWFAEATLFCFAFALLHYRQIVRTIETSLEGWGAAEQVTNTIPHYFLQSRRWLHMYTQFERCRIVGLEGCTGCTTATARVRATGSCTFACPWFALTADAEAKAEVAARLYELCCSPRSSARGQSAIIARGPFLVLLACS